MVTTVDCANAPVEIIATAVESRSSFFISGFSSPQHAAFRIISAHGKVPDLGTIAAFSGCIASARRRHSVEEEVMKFRLFAAAGLVAASVAPALAADEF